MPGRSYEVEPRQAGGRAGGGSNPLAPITKVLQIAGSAGGGDSSGESYAGERVEIRSRPVRRRPAISDGQGRTGAEIRNASGHNNGPDAKRVANTGGFHGQGLLGQCLPRHFRP